MSPIADLQKRGRQIGEIRIGMVVKSENGKPRPTKLDAFRFTTKSPNVAQAVANLLGGEAHPVKLQNGDSSYEVITSATELPVMVPPGDAAISQWYEMWSGGGCQRRCDGETEQLTQTPCKCPVDKDQRNQLAANGGACKPTTRVNVILPDLPDIGVWLIQSHGWYAANELGGAAELLANAREAGVIVPATLRLEQRQVKRAGQTKKFAVPVLEIGATLRDMVQLGSGRDLAAALPPPPQTMAAIGSGKQTVDLRAWLAYKLGSPAEADALRVQWRARYHFPAEAVPADKESEVRRLVESLTRADDDEAIEAELVDGNDPGRPF
jgi:Recombination directionality factor-like